MNIKIRALLKNHERLDLDLFINQKDLIPIFRSINVCRRGDSIQTTPFYRICLVHQILILEQIDAEIKYDILDFRVSINKCYVFSCYYICVLMPVSVYISFGRIFNVAVTRIISTSRLDDRTFDQENSDKPDSGFLFLNIFKETVNYRIFSKL